MRKFNQFPITASFYPKRNTKGGAVIYCKISLRGTQSALATGISIENADKCWRAGALEGRKFNDENFKLQSIRKDIEDMDSSYYTNADEVKRAYLGEEQENIKLTIFNALDWAFEQKKRKVKESHSINIKNQIIRFKKYFEIKNLTDWSILIDHPNKVTRVKVINYYNWMCDNLAHSTSNTNIGQLCALYKTYYKAHQDSIPDLIPNVFSEMQEHGDKQDRIDQAISRKIDWKYVEKINKVRHDILDVILEKKSGKLKKDQKPTELKNQNKRAYGLLTMIIANTGLSFVEFGKEDVLDINHIMVKDKRGLQLSARRVKTGMRYRIPIDKKVAEMIEELKPIMPWKPYVNNKREQDLKKNKKAYSAYRYYLKVLSKAIGIDGELSPHRFRHTFAMRQLNDKGVNLETVAAMLGDTIKTTSENYADYTDKTIQENYNKQTAIYSEMLLRQS